MDIEIKIPYLEDMELGKSYNRCMMTAKDWVLFIDHDVMLSLNSAYYKICKKAIEDLGYRAGWITCKTNATGCGTQLAQDAPKDHNIMEHIKYASDLWKKKKYVYRKINGIGGLLSGFFILTHKKAWEDAGGFKNGFYGVDNDYHERLITKGYEIYLIEGLYVYHIHTAKRRWL